MASPSLPLARSRTRGLGRAAVVASICAVFASLSGCASTSQRLAGWYVTRTLAGYLNLTGAQKSAARIEVDQTITELRSTELPHWITFMREVRQGIHGGLSEPELARLQARYDARLDRGVELLTPRFSPLLAQLDAGQLDHFASRMREDVKELYEDLELPKAKQGPALEKRALKVVEDLVGDLSDEQEASVRRLIRALPNERPVQFRSSLESIARFRGFMAQGPSSGMVELELKRMWEHRYDALGSGHDKVARRAVQRRWLLDVYQLLTPDQHAHAEAVVTERIITLKGWVLPAGA